MNALSIVLLEDIMIIILYGTTCFFVVAVTTCNSNRSCGIYSREEFITIIEALRQLIKGGYYL